MFVVVFCYYGSKMVATCGRGNRLA